MNVRAKHRAIATAVIAIMISTSVASFCTAAQAGASSSIPPGPIKIEMSEPLSGSLATGGKDEVAANKAFVALVIKEGGIAGHKIDLIIGNDQDDPATGVALVAKMISEGVVAMVQPGLGNVADDELAVLAKDKIPTVDPDGINKYSNAKLYPYLFIDYQDDTEAMTSVAKYLQSKGLTKAGLISDGTP